MKKQLEKLLAEAYAAPEPKKKQAFLMNLKPREVSLPEMLWQQAAYVRWPVWLFAVCMMAFAIGGSILRLEDTERIVTVLMPFTAAISVLETNRSTRFGMSEIEMATRFSLRSVLFARMTILGILYAVMLCVSAPVLAYAFGGKLLLTATRILIPYLSTMILSLIAERSALGRKTGYSSAAIAALISLVTFWISQEQSQKFMVLRYTTLLENWGILIVLVLLALTIFEQQKTIRQVEAFA
ncbi:MAG: hypothetical protein J6U66_08990 [Lachnospiraceae bacterium]|nr:hypothetical protein [Lachnospiraceae bacterium]